MLGVYDYTVILTYLSIISAIVGIIFSFTPQLILAAIICLMICGLLDAFDGKVARSKANRTDFEKSLEFKLILFRIQLLLVFCRLVLALTL